MSQKSICHDANPEVPTAGETWLNGPWSASAGRPTREAEGPWGTPMTRSRSTWRCGWVGRSRRDDARIARRWYRTHLVEGGYRLDEGALLEAFLPGLQALGVMTWLEEAHGVTLQRQLIPCSQDILRYGVKTLWGLERSKALPSLRCSDAARLPLAGCHAPQVRQGLCRRGATTRPGERLPGPMCPEPLATTIVKGNLRELERVFNGTMRAWATAGGCGATATGSAEGTALETTARDPGWGRVTRTVRMAQKWGQGHEIAVTVYGWQVRLVIAAATQRPLAVTVGPMDAQEALWTRALVTQARLPPQGDARRHQVSFETGFGDGPTLWWLDQQALALVVPANTPRAVTPDARPQAAAGEDITAGRRMHTVRHGQGRPAWTERLATEAVGITGLTPAAPYGTPAQTRHATRRNCQAPPSQAVVVRQWQGTDDGPGGKPVCLTNASVATPLQPCDAEDERRLIAHCCSKAAQQQGDLGHPPPTNARAVRVHVMCPLLRGALATAYRLQGERDATGGEPVGGQRGRRPLLEQTRDQGIGFAQGDSGLLQRAEYARRWGVRLTDSPPEIGRRQQALAPDDLPVRGSQLCWNFRENSGVHRHGKPQDARLGEIS
jgi:hypothetical protein